MDYLSQDVAIGDLQPNPWNPNKMSAEHEAKLDKSIEEFGLYKPIVVRTLPGGQLEILGGQHRWEAAKRMGMTAVPVANLGDIGDDKAKKVGLVDNGRYGIDDAGLLAGLMKDLGDIDDLAGFLPYTSAEIDDLFTATDIDLDTLDIPDDEIDLPDVDDAKTNPTQIMRFKIQPEDAEFIEKMVGKVMKRQGFKDSDALTNAGDALVYILKEIVE